MELTFLFHPHVNSPSTRLDHNDR